ncbi:MAG: hybrid sensor histidine kinase/response regulator [Gammaproteobacteria bacterium]
MATNDDEEERLRSVTLQNAQSILLARRRAEEALRKQSEWLRVTLSSIGDAVISTDAEGRVTFLNGAAEFLTGWPQAEALGRLVPEIFHIVNERTRQPVENPALRALTEGAIVGLANHSVLIARDGTEWPIDDCAAPIRDEGGAVLGAVLVFRDVTEQRRAERARRESEERFRSLVVATSQVVWTTDPDGKVVEDCPSWRAFTGQTYEQWKGWGWLEAIHPDDRERMAQAWRQCVQDKCMCQTEYRLRAADGSYRWMAVRAVPVLEADGRVREWVGMNTDITERKQAEEALGQSEERFRMLADNMSQLAWTCDLLGSVTWYNQRWYDYTGTTFEEMRDWGWKNVHHPDHVDRVVERVQRSRETGEVWEDTFPLRGRDGDYRWFLSRAIPIRDAAGTVVRWFGTNTDVTELRDAQQALREADRRKDEFLAMLAHELRNPLAPISNAVQVLRLAGSDGEVVHSASEMLQRQVGQMARLVDDLLDVSRITRGKIELRKGRIELAPVLTQAVEAARLLVQSMEHELTVTVPPQPVYLDADPVRLIQVIGNLLNNACKFMDKGGRITLTVEQQGQQAVIRVRDGGIGIAAHQLPRIFEMFTQIDTSLERSVSGLGIGLMLVKSLVEAHGGKVEARSDGLGHGSEFVVRLPILVETPKPPSRPTVSEPTAAMGRRILIVDDNQDGAESLAMLLQLGGHETHMAHDGLEAVEAAERFRPDAMLLDIGLPKLNGYEVCRRIRAQPWGKNMVLVAVTGWGQEEDRHKSREAGFNIHIVKPVDPAALTKVLNGRVTGGV